MAVEAISFTSGNCVMKLSPEIERIIENQLKTGLYSSVSEVLLAALKLLQEENTVALETFENDIRAGLEQAKSGKLIEGSEVFRELRIRNKAFRP